MGAAPMVWVLSAGSSFLRGPACGPWLCRSSLPKAVPALPSFRPPSLPPANPSPIHCTFQVIIIQPQVQTQPESTAESRPPTEEPSQGAQATERKEDPPLRQEDPEVGGRGLGAAVWGLCRRWGRASLGDRLTSPGHSHTVHPFPAGTRLTS